MVSLVNSVFLHLNSLLHIFFGVLLGFFKDLVLEKVEQGLELHWNVLLLLVHLVNNNGAILFTSEAFAVAPTESLDHLGVGLRDEGHDHVASVEVVDTLSVLWRHQEYTYVGRVFLWIVAFLLLKVELVKFNECMVNIVADNLDLIGRDLSFAAVGNRGLVVIQLLDFLHEDDNVLSPLFIICRSELFDVLPNNNRLLLLVVLPLFHFHFEVVDGTLQIVKVVLHEDARVAKRSVELVVLSESDGRRE